MGRPARIAMTIASIAAVAVVAVVVLMTRSDSDAGTQPSADDGSAQVVRDNSHRLNAPGHVEATFVEFLDFECEGCRAAYPMVEEVRAEYGDRVEFVVRYFPLPGHFNAQRAARAVEAAAQQGQLEAMYQKMFETQAQWGEQQTPADDVFRGFAAELGLDLAAFDATYNDPATVERIQLDINDGKELGVRGTPSFFIDGVQVRPRGPGDLRTALDQALQ
ncbi:MAG: DsbA family protein [Mycolicibacterium sp.]|uniref:DsbA family protein n=1 Tax=Mycolicibacterium sp. TaxID=2320850 RepID=UPI003D13784F